MLLKENIKRLFCQNTLLKVILSTLSAWIVIYIVWIQYPQRLMKDDMRDSNQWKGVPFKVIDSSELISNSRYNFIGEKYGTYGDMYGSLNTLFSGLAFSTLIISLLLQMLELKATRKELKEQKNALVDQQVEFKKQTEILSRQIKITEEQKDIADNQQAIINAQFKEAQKKNFSDQFYSLIAERNNLLSHMIVRFDGKELRGFQVISLYAEKFREIRVEFDIHEHDKKFFKDKWYLFTEEIYGSKTYQIQSYFKLYRLLFPMIYDSEVLSDSEKKCILILLRILLM